MSGLRTMDVVEKPMPEYCVRASVARRSVSCAGPHAIASRKREREREREREENKGKQ